MMQRRAAVQEVGVCNKNHNGTYDWEFAHFGRTSEIMLQY